MNSKWKRCIGIGLACAMLAGSVPVMARNAIPDTEMETELETELASVHGYQLTREDLAALNGSRDVVFSHNGKVTFVDGTCSEDPVAGEEDAAKVVHSMMTLIGADTNTEFVPWKVVVITYVSDVVLFLPRLLMHYAG